jgi:hypothetical protein
LNTASAEAGVANRIALGHFRYDAGREQTQTFHLRNPAESLEQLTASFGHVFAAIQARDLHELNLSLKLCSMQLEITDNHGHPNYTCLYRFRVHGYGLIVVVPYEI